MLTLTVHPFALPDQNRAVSLELLPPLTPPSAPTVTVQLRPRQADQRIPPRPPVRARIKPEARVAPKPVEVERRPVEAPKLQAQQAAPQIPEAPPEPVPVTRQAPALQPQVEVPRAQARGRPRPLDTSRAPPTLPQAPAPEVPVPASPSQVQVLTNDQVIQAPVEIRPRERAGSSPSLTTQPRAPAISAPSGGAPAGGGRASGPKLEDFQGMTALKGGLKGGPLACDAPDLYKLTAEERAACDQQFGQRGKGAPDLGLAIAASRQREYDSYEACQNAYRRKDGIPNAYQKQDDAPIAGVVNLPKECVPLKNR